VGDSDRRSSRPRWLLRSGVAVGLCLIVAIVWTALSPNSHAASVFALVVVVAFLAWLVWGSVVFTRYTSPDARLPRLSRAGGFSALACIPLLAGLPLIIIGANAHTHGLVIAGVILIAIELITASIVLPLLNARRSRHGTRPTGRRRGVKR
jgi:hypothetical protein